MNKLLKAFSTIKNQPSPILLRSLKCYQENLETFQNDIIYNKRRALENKVLIKKTKAQIKKETKVLTQDELDKIQSEINKIYTLPIRDCKVVRTISKTGYLPKILILTGLIELEPITQTTDYDHLFFDKYVGKTLGRFLIQYDWSPKNSGPTIAMVNLTNVYRGYHAPTISSGIPCLGNIDSTVRELFDKKEFFSLTETLLDYLSNTLYGSPYCNWADFFNHDRQTMLGDITQVLFKDYPSNMSIKELKQIEAMVPPKEWEILKRDISKDPTYPFISFNGMNTHDNCHCDDCLKVRALYTEYLEFLKLKNLSI